MEYQALYRQFRPEVFRDMVGQEHIVTALSNQIESGRIGHAYLFCGTRGTGKTTTARILSRAVNCENRHGSDPCNECPSCRAILSGSAIDVVEIDAASNTSVDNIRQIRDEITYPPVMLKYKVYIIDEVHMLSGGAFNALLKTLEEPPAHVIFILATTEYHKVPATILSRCQRFDFKRIASDQIQQQLKDVCEKTGATIDDTAAAVISYAADGSMRDGLAILDKCLSFGKNEVTGEIVTKILGIVDDNALFDISACIAQKDLAGLMEKTEYAVRDGRDPTLLTTYLIEHFRCLMIAAMVRDPQDILQMAPERAARYQTHSKLFTTAGIIAVIRALSNIYKTQKEAPNPKVMLEIGLASLCAPKEAAPSMPPVAEMPVPIPQEQPPVSGETDVPPAPPTPVEAPEDSTPPEDTGTVDLGSGVVSHWTELVDLVRKEGKMLVYANLATAYPREQGDSLHIVFKKENEVNRNMLNKPETKAYLEDAILHLTGKPVKVRFLMESESAGTYTKPSATADAMELAKKFPGFVTVEE